MKLMAIGIVYDKGITFSREIIPREDLTDQDILEFMTEQFGGDELDQVLLVTFDEDQVLSEELIG